MNPRNISIKDFSYSLPEEKIAKHPLPDRDASRLLVFQGEKITTDIYRNVANYLPNNSVIVFNNTRVIEARLLFQKGTGGVIEIFCLEPSDIYTNVHAAMTETRSVLWKCLIGGASKWKHGMVLEKKITGSIGEIILNARIHDRETDSFIVELRWTPSELSFAEVLHFAGAIPLPPYIKREVEVSDVERYQTIYARESGSVAAPTAGLHFTPSIFSHFAVKNILVQFVTLHVGAGTFKPVKSELMEGHQMHAESFEVNADVIRNVMLNEKIIAVGTTSARTLETLYWLGVKIKSNPSIDAFHLNLDQWEAYELPGDYTKAESLSAILVWLESQGRTSVLGKTKLLIVPGYKWRILHALVTNFHQPESTLLLLVGAVAGKQWRTIYEHALTHNFRFLSYGDGCLIFVGESKS